MSWRIASVRLARRRSKRKSSICSTRLRGKEIVVTREGGRLAFSDMATLSLCRPARPLLGLAAVPGPPRHVELEPRLPGLDGPGAVLDPRAASFAGLVHRVLQRSMASMV